jgi:hypothetical protein
MAFMFVSCKTSTKAKPETSKPEKPLATGSFNLNGKWKGTGEWKNEYESGTFNEQYEIVQKGMEITLINATPGSKVWSKHYGTLKGNIIHMESVSFIDSKGYTILLPARELNISQDGNTLTSEFDYVWEGDVPEGESRGPGNMTLTVIRE